MKTNALPDYPFTPKSTSLLRPGHFWSVPRSDGRFGCGRVIALKTSTNGQIDSRCFLAGLLDWVGTFPPNDDSIAGSRTFRQGAVHIRAITQTGGAILGIRPLASDGIEPDIFLSHAGGTSCMLQRGFEALRPALETEKTEYSAFPTWGYNVIRILADTLKSDSEIR